MIHFTDPEHAAFHGSRESSITRVPDGQRADTASGPPHDPTALSSQAEPGTGAFPILHAYDFLTHMKPPWDFVEGLLTDGGMSVIYGPSNCGKSFWIVDLAAAVSMGTPFRDEIEVDQGAVIYVALEGGSGVRNRVEALKKSGRVSDDAPFFLIFDSFSLLEPGHPQRLVLTIQSLSAEIGMPVKIVILDTLARAMAGGDENSCQDMTAAVQSIDFIRAATGTHVAVVHHCGKDEGRGARGHSSLRAAVDTEIEITRPKGETISTVRVTKQRDLCAAGPIPFSLKVIELGVDFRGRPISSCVVHHEDEIMASRSGRQGRELTYDPEMLLTFLPASATLWQRAACEETGISRARFYSLKSELERDGKVFREAGTNRFFPTLPEDTQTTFPDIDG